jgi:hypothetical protein
MHLVVTSKFTAINLLVLALTLVTPSWLLVSQLNFSLDFLIRRFLANLRFQHYDMSSSSSLQGITTSMRRPV